MKKTVVRHAAANLDNTIFMLHLVKDALAGDEEQANFLQRIYKVTPEQGFDNLLKSLCHVSKTLWEEIIK